MELFFFGFIKSSSLFTFYSYKSSIIYYHSSSLSILFPLDPFVNFCFIKLWFSYYSSFVFYFVFFNVLLGPFEWIDFFWVGPISFNILGFSLIYENLLNHFNLPQVFHLSFILRYQQKIRDLFLIVFSSFQDK